MLNHAIDPVLLHVGPLEVRYYGLIYALGFVMGYFMLLHLAKKRKIRISKDDASDLILWLLIGVVAGARLFYVLFYNLPYFWQNPFEIFFIWQGGLSFHGGLAGAIVAACLFCRKKKVELLELLDVMAIPAALALALGRIGNFLNGELPGTATNVAWCVNFPGVEGCRHPSQLYAAAKDFFIFTVLWMLKDKNLPKGTLAFTFLLMYSMLRFMVEFTRAPDPQLGYLAFGLTMGQLLNVGLFAIAMGCLAYVRNSRTKSHS